MQGKTIRLCLECGEIILGRSDKKFCSDLCRNSYNNIKSSSANKKLTETNSILKKNRGILEEMFTKRLRKIDKEKLLRKGFNFHYVTGFGYSEQGINCFYCYEYGYQVLNNNYYKLIKQREE